MLPWIDYAIGKLGTSNIWEFLVKLGEFHPGLGFIRYCNVRSMPWLTGLWNSDDFFQGPLDDDV